MRHPEKIRLKDGTVCWQVRNPDAQGVMRYERFATKRDADAAAVRLESARKTGGIVNEKKTVGEATKEFITGRVENHLRPSAQKDIKAHLTRINQFWSHRLLRTVTPSGIEDFRAALLERMQSEQRERVVRALSTRTTKRTWLAAHDRDTADLDREIERFNTALAHIDCTRTANKVLGTFRTLLKFAEGRRYVAYNAATHVRMLKAKSKDDVPIDHACLSPTEIARLVSSADEDWIAALSVLAYGGLRLGELLGLQWGDVEYAANRLLVRRQLEAVTGELRAPKTKAGTRFVELPTFVMTELKRWQLRCPKGNLDLCFPDSAGGGMDDRNFRTRIFYPALRRARLRRIRVHDLRHTAASLMIATGADLAAISRQLGHANVQITLATYTHFFQRRSESGLGARMEALVNKENGCVLVVPTTERVEQHTEVVDLMVARGGIEPPTRGFSIRCSTN